MTDIIHISAKEFDSKAAKAIWDFHGAFPMSSCHSDAYLDLGIYASSRHIPGVRFAGVSHPGLIGTAPSAELLAKWNTREQALIDAHPGAVPAVAFPPETIGAYIGQDLSDEVLEKIKKEGARTIPAREHGGNADVCFLFITFISG
jgi:formamidase